MSAAPTFNELLTLAIDGVSQQIDALTEDDWEKPTPCDGWDVHRVVDHVTDTLVGIRGAIAGGDYRQSKYGDLGRTHDVRDAVTSWQQQAEHAKEAIETFDPRTQATGPMSTGPAEESLRIPLHDLTVHAWDIATGAGHPYDIPEPLLDDLDRLVHAVPEEVLRRPGLFGPALDAPEGASRTEQAMAFLGRRPLES